MNKYDGHQFTVYRGSNIFTNRPLALVSDNEGFIWIGTQRNGLVRLNTLTNEAVQFIPNSQQHSNKPIRIVSLFIDKKQQLWIGTEGNGLYKFHKTSNEFSSFQHNPDNTGSLCSDHIVAITEDEQGKLWIGSDNNGVCYFDQSKQQFHSIDYGAKTLTAKTIRALLTGQPGILWIGTNEGVYQYISSTDVKRHYAHKPDNTNSLSSNNVRALLMDDKEQIWIGTTNDINILNPKTDNIQRITAKYYDKYSLNDNSITKFYQDRSGVIWIGTSSGGINKFNSTRSGFIHLNKIPHHPNTLSDRMIWSVKYVHNYLWIGTKDGINRYNPKTNVYKHYYNSKLRLFGNTGNYVRSIIPDKQNGLWIGMIDGLSHLNLSTEKFSTYTYPDHTLSSTNHNHILSLVLDHDKNLWIGTKGAGVHILDNNKQFRNLSHDDDNPNSLSNDYVYGMHESKKHGLWFLTEHGINQYNVKSQQFKHYYHIPGEPDSPLDNYMLVMYEDENDIYWFGSTKGLSRFDYNNSSYEHYTVKDGLANNVIYAIEKDNNGNIWVGTNQGLSQIDPETRKISNYDISDGLQSNEFNIKASDNDGKNLYFGGINGVTIFDPLSIKKNSYIPSVTIKNIKILNKTHIIPTNNSISNPITISYKDSFFSIEFVVLDFTSPQKNQYAYMLEGFDKHWVNNNNRRFATYTNLNGGDYVFKVKGSNSDGVWNHQGASIFIHVMNPPWKTWWAFSLYISLLLLTILLIIRIKTLAESRSMADRMRRMSSLLTQSLDLNIIASTLTDHISQILPYNQAIILMKIQTGYECIKIRTLSSTQLLDYYEEDKNLLIEVIESKQQPIISTSTSTQNRLKFDNKQWQHGCIMGIPLVIQNEISGIVILFNRKPDTFNHENVDLAITLVMQAGFAIENARLYNETKRLAFFDTLTGLENRRLFKDRLEQALKNISRNNMEVGLLFLDLDQFKRINDTLGHDIGDKLLRKVSARIKKSVRFQDTVARIGGDEFTILLSEVNGASGCERVAKKLLLAFKNPITIDKHEIIVTTSIGISIAPKDCIDSNTLMINADLAMYNAKEQGRNNYQFFRKELNMEANNRLNLDNELRQAINNQEFILQYQPILDLKSNKILSLEALIRWQHPIRGMIQPDYFIPKAEEMGYIEEIGEWVLHNACLQIKAMQAKYPYPLQVSVNLSVNQLRDERIVDTIVDILHKTQLNAKYLKIEITETILIENIKKNLQILHAFKDLGLTIAIDDFGTGYSSLSYLKRLPIDIVKVDRSFVMDIPHDKDDIEITAAVIAMAHKLNLKVIAEGVETKEQLSFLRNNHCDYGQGFYFGHPMDVVKVIEYLDQFK